MVDRSKHPILPSESGFAILPPGNSAASQMNTAISPGLTTLRQMPLFGQLTQAREACQTLYQQAPSPEVQALLGLLCCQAGDTAAGRTHLAAIKTMPISLPATALTDLAGIHILLNEPVEALALLEQALALESDNATARIRRGLVALQTGRWHIAITDFEYGLKHLPASHHAAIHSNLGRAWYGSGQPERALTAVGSAREAISLPDSWPLYRLETDALIALQRWDEAEGVVRRAMAAGMDPKRCLLVFAFILAARDKHDEAEHEVRKGLERYPDETDLWLLLAELTEIRGRFGATLNCLDQVLKREPDNPELWLRRVHLGRHLFNPAWAREAAEKALALTENGSGQQRAMALAAAAGVEEDETRAETLYRKALHQFEDCIPARLGLGRLLLQWGRVDEAEAEFARVKEHHPIAGCSALISARRFPDDPDILARIDRLAHSPSLEGSVRSSLLFNLASSYEHLKDYPKAFAYAEAANRSSRQHLPYDAAAHRQRIQDIKKTFNRDFYDRRQGLGHPSTRPVFVLGMPRSGTTLVEQIIAGHSAIHGAGEIGCLNPVIHSMVRWELRCGSGRNYPDCVQDLTAAEVMAYADKVLESLKQYEPGARHVVDKLPHNFENVGLIRLLFPRARIIHVLREPRDVALSNFFTDYQAKFGGMGFAYDLTDLGKHLVDYQNLMTHWDAVLPEPILTVTYESVIENVEEAARILLDYIGVDWEPQVLDFQNLERPVKTASVWQVRQPVYQTSKAKWQRYAECLTPLEAALREPFPDDPAESPLDPLPPGLFFEGMEYLKAGQAQPAEQCFTRLLTRYPRHAAAIHFLGMACYQQGRLPEALEHVQRSIDLHPGHPDWIKNRGLVQTALAASKRESGCSASPP